jgi:hypothetical protein
LRAGRQARRERNNGDGLYFDEWIPVHFDGRDGVRKTFEAQHSNRMALVTITSAGCELYHVSHQDLSTLAKRTESGCFNHGITEIVRRFL